MHYVKHFNINGVDTKQVACIELNGKPNAATEGYVGILGIDVTSPHHEVYKCVAVNGSIYTWELLSSGLSIIAADMAGMSGEAVQFPYDNLRTPNSYVVKVGDLIIDINAAIYQIVEINSTYCVATYIGIQIAEVYHTHEVGDIVCPTSVDDIDDGKFNGLVVAHEDYQTPSTSLLRNSKLVSEETAPTVDGEIYWQYE